MRKVLYGGKLAALMIMFALRQTFAVKRNKTIDRRIVVVNPGEALMDRTPVYKALFGAKLVASKITCASLQPRVRVLLTTTGMLGKG